LKDPKPTPLVQKIDCVEFYVLDLEAGLVFYRDRLGYTLIWRAEHAVGLGLPGTDAEIVLQDERPGQMIDFKVPSADQAVRQFVEAGGKLLVPPFDIQIGRAAVVQDPWGNAYVLLDASKGLMATDENGRVVGNLPPES
jgi:lactoylglutathione lyase